MSNNIHLICTVIMTIATIIQTVRVEKYKKLCQNSHNNNFSAGRDVNNAGGNITINNGQ